METSLRWVLILTALLIVAGIIWDALRAKGRNTFRKKLRPKVKAVQFKPAGESMQVQDIHDLDRHDVSDKTNIQDKQDIHNVFDNPIDEDLIVMTPSEYLEPNISSESALEPAVEHKPVHYFNPQTIIALNVLARQPGMFSGKKLLEVFRDAHLFHGDMDIYHRYENTDGTGKIMFSVVSAVEPGIFDITKMDKFVTPGLTLFFSPIRPNQAIAAFELMLRTAKLIALRLDGELKDQNRRILTLQGIEKYREKIRASHLLRKAN